MAEWLRGITRRRSVRGRFVAVDFDRHHLHMVVAERQGRKPRIHKLLSADMPAGINLQDPQALGQFLAQALAQFKLKPAGVIMNVPRSQVVLKPLVLPQPEDMGELASMVQFQIAKEMAVNMDETAVDFVIESHYDTAEDFDPKGGLEVLVAAVKHDIVRFYQQVADAAGVYLIRVGLRPYAHLRSMLAAGITDETPGVALVNVTSDETEVDVINGHALAFSRSSTVKVPANGAPSGGQGDEAFPSVDSSLETIVAEAARGLQSFHAVQRGVSISAIYVAGDTGVESRLCELLENRLRVPTRMVDPATPLGVREWPRHPSAFLSVLGLAIGETDATRIPIDFLHPKKPIERRDPARLRRLLIAAAVLLMVAVPAALGFKSLRDKENLRAQLQIQVNDMRQENQRIRLLQRRAQALQNWESEQYPWLDHWAMLSALLPPAQQAHVDGLTTRPDGRIDLTLRATSSEVAQTFTHRLAGAGYHVESLRSTSQPDASGYSHVTDLRLTIDGDMEVPLGQLQAISRSREDIYHPANAELVNTVGPGTRRPAPTTTRPNPGTGTGTTPTTSERDADTPRRRGGGR